jgi:RES domain-containing protein
VTLPGDAVASCPRRRLAGPFWHQGPTRWPLLGITSPAPTNGRYHKIGGPGIWYASSQEQAAWAELFRHFVDEGVDPFEVRRRVGPVHVEDLEVLDLTDPAVLRTLGIRTDQLTDDATGLTQQIASAAHAAGFEGILAPSVALPGRRTLVVFPVGLTKLVAGRDRVTSPPPRLADLLHLVRPAPDVPASVRSFVSWLYAHGSEAIRLRRRSG